MEIGRPIRTVTVEPIADPVPRERPLVPRRRPRRPPPCAPRPGRAVGDSGRCDAGARAAVLARPPPAEGFRLRSLTRPVLWRPRRPLDARCDTGCGGEAQQGGGGGGGGGEELCAALARRPGRVAELPGEATWPPAVPGPRHRAPPRRGGGRAAPRLQGWAGRLGDPFRAWATVGAEAADPGEPTGRLDEGCVGLCLPGAVLADPSELERVRPLVEVLVERDLPLSRAPGPSRRPAGAAHPPWWPALTSYVAEMHAAWHGPAMFLRPLAPDLRICCAMLAAWPRPTPSALLRHFLLGAAGLRRDHRRLRRGAPGARLGRGPVTPVRGPVGDPRSPRSSASPPRTAPRPPGGDGMSAFLAPRPIATPGRDLSGPGARGDRPGPGRAAGCLGRPPERRLGGRAAPLLAGTAGRARGHLGDRVDRGGRHRLPRPRRLGRRAGFDGAERAPRGRCRRRGARSRSTPTRRPWCRWGRTCPARTGRCGGSP